jgi:hypothetical protein
VTSEKRSPLMSFRPLTAEERRQLKPLERWVEKATVARRDAEPGALFRSGVHLGDETTGSPEFLAWADERMRELMIAAFHKQGRSSPRGTRPRSTRLATRSYFGGPGAR